MPTPRDASPSVFSKLFGLALPIIGLNVLNVASLAVDTAMCGRLPESEVALTALGFATQVIFLAMVAMMGLTVGTVAVVARAYGARHWERVNHVMLQSSMLTVGVGLSVAVVGNLLAVPILAGLGAEGAVLARGVDYLRPLLLGSVFYYLSILLTAVLRGVGNTRLPFSIALVSNGLNVVFNYGLILGNYGLPALGVQGAAIGTVLSYIVGVVLLVVMLRRGAIPGLRLSLRPAKLDGALAGDLFRVGAPAALDMLILNASFLSIVGMLGRLDAVAVAAHGIGLRVQSLAFVPGMSISQATAAMVGQALGAGDAARARAVVRASVTLCLMIMTSLSVLLLVFAYPIAHIFDVLPGTLLESHSVLWIRILGYGMPLVGVYIAFVGMMRGAGATRTSLGINIVGTLCFQIPASFVLGFPADWGVLGVWVAFPLAFVIKAAMAAVVYRRGHWARVGAYA